LFLYLNKVAIGSILMDLKAMPGPIDQPNVPSKILD
jgi:hypothetical protein